jgi:tetratricopeptide (TPR) repeat protein
MCIAGCIYTVSDLANGKQISASFNATACNAYQAYITHRGRAAFCNPGDDVQDVISVVDGSSNNVGSGMQSRANRASLTATAGELALTEGYYVRAAKLFGQAASRVPAENPAERLDYMGRQADALWRQGNERDDNDSLRNSIRIYDQILKQLTRARAPLDWAKTQRQLGRALATLGMRETDTARLEQAVVAFRAAKDEWTRAGAAPDWAKTQDDLCGAFGGLGERESGTMYPQEAVAACRAALQVNTRANDPLDWAKSQNDLCIALDELGERESGTAHLKSAVTACRAALEVNTRARLPLAWAKTQYTLGIALADLGE